MKPPARTKVHASHGGARRGAGRKPSPNPLIKITIRVSKEHLVYLHSLDPNLSQAIRTLIKTAHP